MRRYLFILNLSGVGVTYLTKDVDELKSKIAQLEAQLKK
jgi:hypothetical protein